MCVLIGYGFQIFVQGGALTFDEDVLVRLGAFVPFLKWEPARFIMSGFLHGDIKHLLFNLIPLAIITRGLETYLPPVPILLVFLLSVITGCVATQLWLDPFVVSVGASAGVMGLLTCYLTRLYFMKISTQLKFTAEKICGFFRWA